MVLLCSMSCLCFCALVVVFFTIKHDIFIIKKLFCNTRQVICYHFFIFEIIVKSVNFITCQNRIENYYHHDGEQSGFYKIVHIKTQGKKKNLCTYWKNKEFQFIWKNLQSWTKYLQIFSFFSTIFLHHKWNGTRLLSPESKYTSCRTT